MMSKTITALCAAFVAVAALGANSQSKASQLPKMPFIDRGACPFEGCVYGDWKAEADVDAFEHPGRVWSGEVPASRLKKLFRIKSGETVRAMTGVVVFSKPGRARINKPLTAESHSRAPLGQSRREVRLPAGAIVYLLTYHGEFEFTAWFRGQLIDLDKETFDSGDDYSPCSKDCDGEVIERGRSEWWVQVRNPHGQIGWTNRPNDFAGKDAFGPSSRSA